MNTSKEQSSALVVDPHFHACSCGAYFSHSKKAIQPGSGHYAHRCPVCDRPVNEKVAEVVGTELCSYTPDWYGPRGLAARVSNLDTLPFDAVANIPDSPMKSVKKGKVRRTR